MRTQTYVVLDSMERREVRHRAVPNAGIELEHMPEEEAIKAKRLLNHLADGGPISQEQCERAIEIVEALVARCAEQARVDWWTENVIKPVPEEQVVGALPGVPSSERASLPLVMNPSQFVVDMAHVREGQLCECSAVLELLREVRAMYPMGEREALAEWRMED